MDRPRLRAFSPFESRDYRLLFLAVVISVIATGMWSVVLVFTVIGLDGGPAELSLVAASGAVGVLLCAIPGGIVADRLPQRSVAVVVEVLNVVCLGVVGLLGSIGSLELWHLVASAFVLGASAGFFYPAYSAYLPRILPPEHLLAANGLEATMRAALQQAAGPAIGGIILAVLLPQHATVVIASAHVLAVVALLLLRRRPARELDRPLSTSVLHDLREGVRFTLRTPWLLSTLLFSCFWVLILAGPLQVLLPFLASDRFGPEPTWFASLIAAFGAGGIVGSVVVSSLRLPRRYLSALMLAMGVGSLPFVIVGITNDFWIMTTCCFLLGGSFSYAGVIWGTLLQRRVPTALLGRVSSLDFFVSIAFLPVSMAVAGPIGEVLPIWLIFAVAGVLPLPFALVALRVARMRDDELLNPIAN